MLADRLGLRDPNVLAFCWIIDFPFVIWNEDENRWDPSHHLFTSPMPDDIPLLDNAVDIVVNQQVLEHIEHPKKINIRYGRCLKYRFKILISRNLFLMKLR